jgi:hypothetical protein
MSFSAAAKDQAKQKALALASEYNTGRLKVPRAVKDIADGKYGTLARPYCPIARLAKRCTIAMMELRRWKGDEAGIGMFESQMSYETSGRIMFEILSSFDDGDKSRVVKALKDFARNIA